MSANVRIRNISDEIHNIITVSNAITQTARTIKKDLTAYGFPKEPLFLTIGRNNSIPSHAITQLLVAEYLRAEGYKISFGLQHPYNDLSQDFYAHAKKSSNEYIASAALDNLLKSSKPYKNELALKKYIATQQESDADLSNRFLATYLYAQEIPVIMNDAPITKNKQGRTIIDFKDPAMKTFLKPPSNKPVRANTEKGLHIRNLFLAHQAIKHAEETGADIHIQSCENPHVAGKKKLLSYEHSLTNMFHQASRYTISAPMQNRNFESSDLPDQENMDEKELILEDIVLPGMTSYSDHPHTKEDVWLRTIIRDLLEAHDDIISMSVFNFYASEFPKIIKQNYQKELEITYKQETNPGFGLH